MSPTSGPAWQSFFDEQRTVECPTQSITFNIYTAGSTGPVVLCLHGGGYSGLTWALVAARLRATCRIIAPDLRAHGLTQATNESDLSAATLAADVAALWAVLFPSMPTAPPAIILGHSMGGAIAVHAAGLPAAFPTLAGVAVLDVVEGTALASLPYMQAVLERRPSAFASLEAAVTWAMESGTSRCKEAAQVSVPSMLVERRGKAVEGGNSGAKRGLHWYGNAPGRSSQLRPPSGLSTVSETEGASGDARVGDGERNIGNVEKSCVEEEDIGIAVKPTGAAARGAPCSGEEGSVETRWVWRTPLEESAQYWDEWYRGLSEAFLGLKVPKILILAGTDRLDKTLMIGQMQGKFQLVLLPRAGHAVHEDEPEAVADAVLGFIKRFKVGQPLPRIRSTLPKPIAADGPNAAHTAQQ